ncbi:MAG: hypothetical protein HZB29_00735 [Nitrospinae bacterium]|nr:hypothetical protein [Nitrospinota bacterium]
MKRPNIAAALALVAAVMAAAGCSEVSPYVYTNYYALTQPVYSSEKQFKDDALEINFWFDEKKIHFAVKNVSAEPVVIDWGRGAFVNIDGAKHSLANMRSIFTAKRDDPEPSTLNPGETVEDYVSPVKNVEKLEEWTWYVYPLFNLKDDKAKANKGQTIGLDLPVKVKGDLRTYAFRFEVAAVIPAWNRFN